MGVFQVALILATFLCSLVAGFLFAFAVVAMPGIGKLNNREFIRAFQAMDGIIQNNQPIFLLVWVGSVIALVAAALLGVGRLDGAAMRLVKNLNRSGTDGTPSGYFCKCSCTRLVGIGFLALILPQKTRSL